MELDEIIKGTGLLFRKFGIKSVTMDDISRQLGISKKTLYQFVSDKNELVTKVLDMEMKSMESCFFDAASIHKENAIEQLINVSRHVRQIMNTRNPSSEYDLNKYYPELYKSFNEFRNKLMYSSVLKNLIKGKEEGIYREELNPEYIARFYVSRVELVMEDKAYTDFEEYPPEFFAEIFIYHIRGLANEKGLKFLEDHMSEITNYNPQ